jgi:hypothetical protein
LRGLWALTSHRHRGRDMCGEAARSSDHKWRTQLMSIRGCQLCQRWRDLR